MAGSGDRPQQPGRRGREIEEGEFVHSGYYTGSDTDTDDEDARYYLKPRCDGRVGMMPLTRLALDLGNVVLGGGGSAGARSRSVTVAYSPSSSPGSDGTVSDADARAGGGAGAAVKPDGGGTMFPACPVCHRQFHSSKAVHGHMRVHAQAKEEKVSTPVSAVKEEVSGGGSVSVSVSMDIVVAEPKVSDEPMPAVQVASGDHVVPGSVSSSSASVEPSQTQTQSGDQSMAITVAVAPPSAALEEANTAPPPAAPQQVPVAPSVAPAPQEAAVHPPAPAQQHVAVPPQPQVFHGPLHMVPHDAWPPAPAGDSQRGFSCKECYRWFPTHQGLGGHVAGHKNRRIAAAAKAAAAAGLDPADHVATGGRPERQHECKMCPAVFSSGVALGGHMRKHYRGAPIVPRKRLRVGGAELGLAPPQPWAPAMEAPIVAAVAAQPAQEVPVPVVPAGSFRIFGVTIVQQAKQEEEEQEEPAVDDEQKQQ